MTNNQFAVLTLLDQGEKFSCDFTGVYGPFGMDGMVLRSMLYHDYIRLVVGEPKMIDVGFDREREVPTVEAVMTDHGDQAFRDEVKRRKRVERRKRIELAMLQEELDEL